MDNKYEENLPKHHPQYGGTLAYYRDLPVGTKFYVCNGAWNGEIKEIEGVNKVYVVETDKYHDIGEEHAWIRTRGDENDI